MFVKLVLFGFVFLKDLRFEEFEVLFLIDVFVFVVIVFFVGGFIVLV